LRLFKEQTPRLLTPHTQFQTVAVHTKTHSKLCTVRDSWATSKSHTLVYCRPGAGTWY